MSRWFKPRKPMKKYPKTDQQKKITVAGRVMGKVCKGKRGTEFRQCKIEVMSCVFKDEKCSTEILQAKGLVQKGERGS